MAGMEEGAMVCPQPGKGKRRQDPVGKGSSVIEEDFACDGRAAF